jgi:hypothetical protein
VIRECARQRRARGAWNEVWRDQRLVLTGAADSCTAVIRLGGLEERDVGRGAVPNSGDGAALAGGVGDIPDGAGVRHHHGRCALGICDLLAQREFLKARASRGDGGNAAEGECGEKK